VVEEALGLGDVRRGRRENGGEDVAVLLDLLALVGDRRRAGECAVHGFVRPPLQQVRRSEGLDGAAGAGDGEAELGFWPSSICGDGERTNYRQAL
jgi:hypothetical protein